MARTERSGHTTTDHDFIRTWVEERGGWPARVAGTEGRGDDAGLIRVDFPGYSGEGSLERIEWEEWFQKFDDSELAFLHRDMSHGGGDLDRFNKLVRRSGDDNESSSGGRSSRSSSGSASKRSSSSSGSASKRSSSSGSGSSRSSSSRGGGASTTRSSGSKRASASESSSGGSSRSSGSKSGGASKSSGSKSSGGARSSSNRSSSGSKSSGGTSSSSKSSGGAKSSGSKSSSGGGSKSAGGSSSSKSSAASGGGSSRRSLATAVRETLLGGGGNGDGPGSEMRELLKHELGDLLFAEKVFLKGTKTLAKEAQDPTVKARLEEHVRETEGHIERLNEAFRSIGERPKAEECPAALGLKEEHDSFKSEEKPSKMLLSAFDLGSGLRVEHYEIAAYRTTIAVATAMGERECANILKENLKEELAMAAFLEKNAPIVLKAMARA